MNSRTAHIQKIHDLPSRGLLMDVNLTMATTKKPLNSRTMTNLSVNTPVETLKDNPRHNEE